MGIGDDTERAAVCFCLSDDTLYLLYIIIYTHTKQNVCFPEDHDGDPPGPRSAVHGAPKPGQPGPRTGHGPSATSKTTRRRSKDEHYLNPLLKGSGGPLEVEPSLCRGSSYALGPPLPETNNNPSVLQWIKPRLYL